MKICGREKLQYMVGGLLYCTTMNTDLARKIENNSFPCLTSIAFCLEDSICDEALEKAQEDLLKTLEIIDKSNIPEDRMPLIFVRIRTPEHMRYMHGHLKAYYNIITGYVLPKFDLSNCDEYRSTINYINADRTDPLYIMPVLESRMVADAKGRLSTLMKIKDNIDSIKEYVLNVRVGGNDFSNIYGIRRSVDQNIYQIGVIRDILVDIINVFAPDYVVSGPVWEYFGTDTSGAWATGLKEELALDRINGFIGKTSIHPGQLPLIYESMKVRRSDYNDALSILRWNSSILGVEKSSDGSRMNEVKCHKKWAVRIAAFGEIYGII